MRLVSLWWELPPRLDSNSSIWNLGLQEKSAFSFVNFSIPERNLMIAREMELLAVGGFPLEGKDSKMKTTQCSSVV